MPRLLLHLADHRLDLGKPVRIALEGDGAKLDVLRPGLSVIVTVNEKSPR